MSEEINEEEKNIQQPDKGDSDDRIAGGVQNHLHLKSVSGMYRNWFIDYASYVILERAVPEIDDGLKPVQRRILHAMKRLDDGRYNKVANIVGFTMQYHPHGDASIGDALVQLGQKELLIDTQGNWGNILTGDSAAAPRYIEARLSKLALDVVFNPKTTQWKLSYDGRNKEPITLPVKFPLLLAQGVEGIAVGLSSKILPHNFNELMDASIAYLRKEDFVLYPDFLTGGSIDVSKYQDGARGGKLRVRAKIEKVDKRMLAVTELPYGTTTESLTESIKSASEKGKIKIKHIDDKTAATVRIEITLNPDVSPDVTIDALYAFTDCEISLSANSCVIMDNKPHFLSTTEILKHSVDRTVALLTQELQILLNELADSWHDASLEKIFIENHIYNLIEDCETWEAIVETIDTALDPFKHLLKKPVTIDDITHLTELKIKRISKYDAFKADNYIKSLEKQIEEAQYRLNHIIDYTIEYYQGIKDKYGHLYPRRTEIKSFDNIVATEVAVANEKLYVNWQEGFAGMALKKDEFVCNCSNLDEVIVFHKSGKYTISKISDKFFIGNDAIYVNVFRKNDERTIYNAIYRDGKTGITYAKRFNVKGITRDKEYDVTTGKEGSKILYFTANMNGEAEVIKVTLRPTPRIKKLIFDKDFKDIAIKGKQSLGNILSKNEVLRIGLKSHGVSTLGGRKVWFDRDVLRLNYDGRGEYLGEFQSEDSILVVQKNAEFFITNFDINNHYPDNILFIEKFDADKVWSAAVYDADQKFVYIKRFKMEAIARKQSFLNENPNSYLILLSSQVYPRFLVKFGGADSFHNDEEIDVDSFIACKGFKAKGKRVSTLKVDTVAELEPLRFPEPDEADADSEAEDGDDENTTANINDADTDKSQSEIFDELTGQMRLFDGDAKSDADNE